MTPEGNSDGEKPLVHTVRPAAPEAHVPGARPPLLLLRHGVGTNERQTTAIAPAFDPRFVVASVRSPLTMGPDAFGWFHMVFTANGPVIAEDEASVAAGPVDRRTVPVQGSAGAVGSCAVQLARRAGALVIATVRSSSDEPAAFEAGAHSQRPYFVHGPILGGVTPSLFRDRPADASEIAAMTRQAQQLRLMTP